MPKVKTFTTPMKIFHGREELEELDEMLNGFIGDHGIDRVISVSDTCTTDDTGATIGIIRVLAYE